MKQPNAHTPAREPDGAIAATILWGTRACMTLCAGALLSLLVAHAQEAAPDLRAFDARTASGSPLWSRLAMLSLALVPMAWCAAAGAVLLRRRERTLGTCALVLSLLLAGGLVVAIRSMTQ